MRLLAEAGADVVYEPRYRTRPLDVALTKGTSEAVIAALLEAGASVWGVGRRGAKSPAVLGALAAAGSPDLAKQLVSAASQGSADAVRALLELGIEPRGDAATALAYACRWGRAETAALLLSAGADPDHPAEMALDAPQGVAGLEGRLALTPLEAAAGACPTMIGPLLDAGADRARIVDAARYAGWLGQLDAIDALAAASDTPETVLRRAAIAAAEAGQVEVARALLARPSIDGAEGSLLIAALRGASANPSEEERRTLLHEVAALAPDLAASEGTTVLHLAARLGEAALLARALEAGVAVDALDDRGRTALACVRGYEDPAAVDLLLGAGADPNARVEDGTPILVDLALHGNALEHVRRLLEGGADPNAAGPRAAALHQAAWQSEYTRPADRAAKVKMVGLLLEHGADVFARDGRGRTPLSIAMETGLKEAAALLEAASPPLSDDPREALAQLGFDFDASGFRRASSPGQVTDALERFVAAGFELDSDAGYDALLEAIEREHVEVARYLVEHGAPLRSARPNPLCRAANTRSERLVAALLALGADPNGPAPGSATPLVDAARALAPSVVERLLEAGADPDAGDGAALFALTQGVRNAMEDGDFSAGRLNGVVAELARGGADLEVARDGVTPLVRAAQADLVPLAHALVRAGADPEPARAHAKGEAMRKALSR